MAGLEIDDEDGAALRVHRGGRPLLRYVYRPADAQFESPRPYLHPMWTLDGQEVTLHRPHDHVWHKGVALSLPNVRGPGGSANFWGGPTYVRGRGYVQLPNDGAMRHREFTGLSAAGDTATVAQTLHWVTEPGATWFTEARALAVAVDAGRWTLRFDTRITNVSGAEVVFGSPTTEGRDNAGYGGLFWRGPRSFTGGTAYVPGRAGADDLMGVRAPWMAFTGVHDGSGARSTLVMVDGPDNPGHPTRWFVRSEIFAGLCPAPFFDTEVALAPGAELALRYAVVVADGDPGLAGAASLADAALEWLR
jgi:hypothetical protein